MKKKIKIISLIIFCLLLIDILHYFVVRINPEYSDYSESFYESDNMTYIKWGLLLVSLIGLRFLRRTNIALFLIGLSGMGMVVFFFIDGPLSHFLKTYSSVYFWILLIGGVYLFWFFIKNLRNKTLMNQLSNGSD